MASLKIEQTQKVEKDQEAGREVTESGEQNLEEAEVSRNALESIEAIDDADKAAVDATITECEAVAKTIAESEIKEPGRQIGESLKETSDQSREYSETEMADAEKASEMVGDYSSAGGELASELQASGQEFLEIADQGDQVKDELDAELAQIAAELEGVY